jgi:hypothetical protein
VSPLHPAEPFGSLDMLVRRQLLGIVERRRQDLDNSREQLIVAVEEACSAVGTKIAHRRTRRVERLWLAFFHSKVGFLESCPANDGRT